MSSIGSEILDDLKKEKDPKKNRKKISWKEKRPSEQDKKTLTELGFSLLEENPKFFYAYIKYKRPVLVPSDLLKYFFSDFSQDSQESFERINHINPNERVCPRWLIKKSQSKKKKKRPFEERNIDSFVDSKNVIYDKFVEHPLKNITLLTKKIAPINIVEQNPFSENGSSRRKKKTEQINIDSLFGKLKTLLPNLEIQEIDNQLKHKVT